MTLRRDGSDLSIAGGVREFAIATPNVTAVVDGDRELTYAQLGERSSRVAQALLRLGLDRGDRVAVVLGNRLEYCEVAAGIAKAALVSVPVNPRLTGAEMAYIVGHSGSRAVIADTALAGAVAPALGDIAEEMVLGIGEAGLGREYEAVIAEASATDPGFTVPETDPFTVCYTAGTTGKPKGVVISHRSRSLTFYCTALEWGLGPGQRTIAVAPMYHGAGFAFAYAAVHTGGTLAMLRSFDPERLLAMVEGFRPHSIFLVPSHVQMLRALGEDRVRQAATSGLDAIYVNAAPMPQQLKRWTIDVFPQTGLWELYGSTEAGVVTTLRPADQLRKEQCVGHPWFMTEVRVVRRGGEPVSPGEPGELYSRSPFVFSGYLHDPQATAACTTDDGFVSAGDVAILDDERYIYIVDRLRDVIISGGTNVYPREVEEVLFRHPRVADVAVVGVPDEKWGERVVAVVVPRGEAPEPQDLIAFCRSHLAGYKLPKQVEYSDALPRNASGKVLKTTLRKHYAGAGEATAAS